VTTLSRWVAWVLAGFYSLVPNYAVAIILLGLTFMAMIVPLTLKSTRSMLAMQKLQPKLKQLQQQHKNDRLAFNQAATELYREEGVSPFGSCLPTLLPLPLFYVLYRVINGLSHASCVHKICTAAPLYLDKHTKMYGDLVRSAPLHSSPPGTGARIHSFGINLATSAWTAISHHLGAAAIFGSLLLLVIMIGANYYQQVQIMNLNPMVRQNQQMNSQMQIMRFFPIVFGLVCLHLASGLVLYYSVSALFRVGQQWMMYRYDPQVKALVARDSHDIDAIEARFEDKTPPPTDKVRKPKQALPPPNRAKVTSTAQLNGKPPGRYAGTASNAQRNRNRRRRGR
jgi:YidC/Oxa1 family membrane protein insertase